MTALAPALQVLLAAVALIAGVYDIRYRRIPNWLVLPALLVGLLLNGFLYYGPGLRESALGIGLALLVDMPLYLLRARGAGDVKLMAAIGAIVGWRGWLAIFILSAILGGVFAVILTLARGRLRQTFWNVGCILSEMAHFRAPHWRSPELDIQSPRALTLPSAAVTALGCLAFLAGSAILAR
jgi:prepilin peptidase CpaA